MKRYLIDTQVLIWSIVSVNKLRVSTQKILAENDIFVSYFSLMEIAIKQTVKKLPNFTIEIEKLVSQLAKDNVTILSIKQSHIYAYSFIPFYEKHRDPFDRFLLATALAEDMPIISADKDFKLYASQVTIIEA